MRIRSHNAMVNSYAHQTITEVLGTKEVRMAVMDKMKDLTIEEANNLIYSFSLNDEYSQKRKILLQKLDDELNEVLNVNTIHDGINEPFLKKLTINKDDDKLNIVSNTTSFTLPYPKSIVEYILTIDTIKHYFEVVEELTLYEDYKEDVENVLTTGVPMENLQE